MDRVIEILPAGSWAPETATDNVCLAYDDRLRRRKRYTAAGGHDFLLDLPELRLLSHGDGLRLASGAVVAVEAQSEALIEVMGDAAFLARVAWHLGNRHVPVEISDGSLRLRDDRVMADLLMRLGAHMHSVTAPFTPEGGAYGALGHHGGHAHDGSGADSHTHGHRTKAAQ